MSVKTAPKLPSIEMEQKMMKEHERFGHYHRVVDRQRARDDHLKRVREEIAAESPESRRARKARFKEVVYGMRN